MVKKLTNSQTLFLLSALCWTLIASILNLLGNVVSGFFVYQEYFLTCALFGLALGCFAPVRPDAESSEAAIQLDSQWLIWLTSLMLLLTAITCGGYPLGPANAINAVLFAIQTYADHAEFIKGPLQMELMAIAVIAILFFGLVRLFRSFGLVMSQTAGRLPGSSFIMLFSAGAVASWTVYLVILFLGVPVQVLFVICLAALVVLHHAGQVKSIVLAVTAAVCSIVIGVYGVVLPTAETENQKVYYNTLWANGSRIDSFPIMNGSKLVGLVVNIDHQPYQFLPVKDVNADDMHYLHSKYMLPEISFDYRALPYLAMPDLEAKKALILGSGLGNHVTQALAHKIPFIKAVESQDWLLNLARKTPIAPYSSAAVSAELSDARQFLKNTNTQYDLILYAAEVTQTQANPFIIAKPENFLLTKESFAAANEHLAPGGKVVVEYSELNPWVRTCVATNLVKVYGDLLAELKSPYTCFLISAKPSKFSSGDAPPNPALQNLGPKVVRDPAKLRQACAELPQVQDNLPFMLSMTPSLPMIEMFMINAILILFLTALRSSPHQPVLSSITRITTATAVFGIIFMTSLDKAAITIVFNLGFSPVVSFGAVIACWLILLGAGVVRAKLDLPAWALWIAFYAGFLADFLFDYETTTSYSDPMIKFAVCALLPLLPVLGSALLLSNQVAVEEPRRAHIGFALFGLAMGCLLQKFAAFLGISTLNLFAIVLGTAILLINVGQTGSKPEAEAGPGVEAAPAATS